MKHILSVFAYLQIAFIMLAICIVLGLNACRADVGLDTINLNANQNVSLADIFQEARIVQLENSGGSLIAQISQVIYFDNKFYVLDRKQQKIFCFDDSGKFVSTISQQGHGPGEYTHVSHMTVDVHNKTLILLSPPAQQLLVFDLKGSFLKEHFVPIESVMGLNKVFSLNDSIYLLASLTEHQLVYYNNKHEDVIKKDLPLPVFIPQMLPVFNTYQFDGRTFVNPAISQEVIEVTKMNNKPHFVFDYSLLNNTERHISALRNSFQNSPDIHSLRRHELVRSDGYLNNALIKVMESNRFVIQLVATENSIKHVVIDKALDETFVFDFFIEDVVINMHFDVHQDNFLIAYESRFFRDEESNKKFFGPWYPFYKATYFNNGFLSPLDVMIIDQHNPMTDNPFLVVYKFKE